VGERANYVVVKGGVARVGYSPWGAYDVADELRYGPGIAKGMITEDAGQLMDPAFAEGGILVDVDLKLLIAFMWLRRPSAGPEAILRAAAARWPSDWTLRWDTRGVDAFAEHLASRGIEVAREAATQVPRSLPEVYEVRGGAPESHGFVLDGLFFALRGHDGGELILPDDWSGHDGQEAAWPAPGEWLQSELYPGATTGLRLLRPRDLCWWLNQAGEEHELWLVEAEQVVGVWRGVLAGRARLVRKLDWGVRTSRAWACDCVEHVLDLYGVAGDGRPRGALVAARKALDDGLWHIKARRRTACEEAGREAPNPQAALVAQAAACRYPSGARAQAALARGAPRTPTGFFDVPAVAAEERWQTQRLMERYLGIRLLD